MSVNTGGSGSDEQIAASVPESRPVYGVRIARGVVTHWDDKPIMDRAQAEECLRVIEKATGETGEVEYLFVSLPFAGMGE